VVMGKIKKEKTYSYKMMLPLLVMAFLPLVFGGSIGPEAGLTGIIAALCYWVGDNVRYAREQKKRYSEIGEALTLGVIFHAPLFGIFAVEEDTEEGEAPTLPKLPKLVLYGIAIGAAFLIAMLLTHFFGAASEGLPRLTDYGAQVSDYLLILAYIPIGIILYLFFELSEKITKIISKPIPVILRSTIGGVLIGVAGMLVPITIFSGEEQMGELATTFASYAPWFLIAVAFLRCFLTTWSINFGFKGGHFFPVIFSCVCLGFGIAMLIFSDGAASHVVFAAGVLTATALGAQLKKPIAVAMLLLLMFPVRMILVIFLAATIGSMIGKKVDNISSREENNEQE
ncbi:MAG: chloride channel protein, partial [Eubacterium sp.]|nr:chloride channel protein [Eubacterium sp.]